MPGVTVVTDISKVPKTLASWAGLQRIPDEADYPETTTLRRDPNDTSGAIILVGPDQTGCILPLLAGEWFWEHHIDPSGVCIQSDGTAGVHIYVVWGGRRPDARP